MSTLNQRKRDIEVQVGGKVILSGEHSVVYGFPALACSLNQGLFAQFSLDLNHAHAHVNLDSEQPTPTLSLPQLSMQCTPFEDQDHPAFSLSNAFYKALVWVSTQLNLPQSLLNVPLSVKIEGPLPFQVGLGSSAAISVALIQGLGLLYGRRFTHLLLNEGVLELEKSFHGQPSGLDHTVILQGGLVGFKKKAHPSSSDSLHYHLSSHPISHPFCLVLSWVPRQGQTADAVHLVRQNLTQYPELHKTLERMGELTLLIEKSYLEGDFIQMGQLFNENHQCLSALGVSLPQLDRIQKIACQAGAWGAKLTGAGLGGCVIALCNTHDQADQVEQALQNQGLPTWQTWIMR